MVSDHSDIWGKPTWGWIFTWHDRPGGTLVVTSKGHDSPESAFQAALESALRFGYTRPRWWEWWRWSEQNEFRKQPPLNVLPRSRATVMSAAASRPSAK
jgi:hypothetical protein